MARTVDREMRRGQAELLQAALAAQGGEFAHLQVKAHGDALRIVNEIDGAPWIVARLTPAYGRGQWALWFRSHTGKYEPMFAQGTLEQMAETATTILGAYLAKTS